MFFSLIHLTYTSQPRALAIEVEPLKGIVLNLVILLFQDWVELFSYISATIIKKKKVPHFKPTSFAEIFPNTTLSRSLLFKLNDIKMTT